MKIDSVQWGINLGKSQELQISGFKAPTSEMVDHLKKMSIDESNGLYYRNIYQENWFLYWLINWIYIKFKWRDSIQWRYNQRSDQAL